MRGQKWPKLDPEETKFLGLENNDFDQFPSTRISDQIYWLVFGIKINLDLKFSRSKSFGLKVRNKNRPLFLILHGLVRVSFSGLKNVM